MSSSIFCFLDILLQCSFELFLEKLIGLSHCIRTFGLWQAGQTRLLDILKLTQNLVQMVVHDPYMIETTLKPVSSP